MAGIVLGIIVVLLIVQTIALVGIEYYQLKKNKKLLASFTINGQYSKTLVVYFSRSGSTALMAYQIAELKNAVILNIEAEDYKIGLKGWLRAMIMRRKQRLQ